MSNVDGLALIGNLEPQEALFLVGLLVVLGTAIFVTTLINHATNDSLNPTAFVFATLFFAVIILYATSFIYKQFRRSRMRYTKF